MDAKKLDSCTPGQRLVIETFDKPLMVAAGAGSGKTFTLTQRTVNAFSPASGIDPVVSSLDEILVITFTKKAAAELRDRIRRRLDEEGFSDIASRVDTAWVSTIHGMASRILRENALELGLDPAFEVISENQANELEEQALNDVIQGITPEDALLYGLLKTDSLTRSPGSSFGRSSARSQAKIILERVEALPAGFDGLVIEESSSSPFQYLTLLLEAAQDYYDLITTWTTPVIGKSGKPLKETYKVQYEAAFAQAIPLAQTWLEDHPNSSFTDEDFGLEEYLEVFFSFPKLSRTFGKERDALDFTKAYRDTYSGLTVEMLTQAGCGRLKAVVELAKRVNIRLKELKGVSRMDNTDLLRRAYEALRDHEAIAHKYQNQFKLIMVDEFQDTDKLQVALIKLLAQPDLSNVCTVGDAQQSIYRFRGADVEVFKDYRRELPSSNDEAQMVELGDNFRSHGDVLAIVDTIFRQQNAFGGEFLHLEPKGKVNAEVNPIFNATSEGGLPRIAFDIIQYKVKSQYPGLTSDEVVVLGAYRIAEHFAKLIERGVASDSMALLLGKMTNADLYAQALREVGIESVIAGGSVFCSSPEALLVNNLLRVAVNRQDEEALLGVLISPLFSLSDDTLLILSRGADTKGSSLAKGFFAISAPLEGAGSNACEESSGEEGIEEDRAARIRRQLSAHDETLWAWSQDLLRTFVAEARTGSVAEALRHLFVYSGLFARLETQGAEGVASAGNFAKALHLVRGFEDNASGLASVALAYECHLATAKEAPGALATENTHCLQIMTVHASKGLEFKHVALADMKNGVDKRAGLVVENVGDNTYASLSFGFEPKSTFISDLRKHFDEAQEEDITAGIRQDQTTGLRHEVLVALKKQQELEEAQRLFYVALTRAVESLYVECVNGGTPTSNDFTYKGIMDIMATALNWDDHVKAGRELIEYGGSAPAEVTFQFLSNTEELAEALEPYIREQDQEEKAFVVPRWAQPVKPLLRPLTSPRADVSSYSSLAAGHSAEMTEVAEMVIVDGNAPASVGVLGVKETAAQGIAAAEGVTVAEDGLAESWVGFREVDATDFGSAFHELAQRAILLAQAQGLSQLPMLSRADIEQKLTRFAMPEQADRLEAALKRWISSDLAIELAQCGQMDAEVPFMVRFVDDGGQVRYLEGSIDALGVKENGEALLVDYKTGGSPDEAPEALRAKHALQAQCYSYALLDAGYPSVDANFVRMEQHVPGSDQPQVVRYYFTQEDKEALQKEISALMFA